MSFASLPSDITDIVDLCKSLLRECRDAGGEYDETSDEVKGLHTVLRHLNYEVEDPESLVNIDRTKWGGQLDPIICDCDSTLRKLEDLLRKYGRHDLGDKGTKSSRRHMIEFSRSEMDQLGIIRLHLISRRKSLTQFLNTLQLHQSADPTNIPEDDEQLDVILDKVDAIAARMARRPDVGNSSDDYEKFRRELVAEGFSNVVLQQHKDILRAYIREIDQKGLLDEGIVIASRDSPHIGFRSDQLASSENEIFKFDSVKTTIDDRGAKEMVFREDSMKFSPSMKLERMKPDVSVMRTCQHLDTQSPSKESDQRTASSLGIFSPPPQLTISDEKHPYGRARDSSDSDSEADQVGVIIRTIDLLAMSQALQIRPQASPRSFDSYNSAFEDNYGQVFRDFPDKSHDITAFPMQPGAIPIPASGFRASVDRSVESSSQGQAPHSILLAPDSHGKEIPPDAKWTKITRRLVTPEVFHQDGRRYEARPDFVAVLGVLSREEINNYAARSYILRAARSRPRTKPSPSSSPRTPRPRLHRQASSSSSSDEYSSDSDHHRKGNPPRSNRDSQRSKSNTKSQRPASSKLSASRELSPRHNSQASQREQPRWVPNLIQGGQGRSYHPPSEKETGYSRRRHGDSSSSHSSRSKDRGSRNKESEKISRWTAAGLGGAAASLLGVLSEAAEGL